MTRVGQLVIFAARGFYGLPQISQNALLLQTPKTEGKYNEIQCEPPSEILKPSKFSCCCAPVRRCLVSTDNVVWLVMVLIALLAIWF